MRGALYTLAALGAMGAAIEALRAYHPAWTLLAAPAALAAGAFAAALLDVAVYSAWAFARVWLRTRENKTRVP